MLFAPLLDLYFGQKTTIALWLCLHLFLHLRQRPLYVLLPVSGFMKKSHSCFAFFDNLGIVKTPFTCLNRESRFAPLQREKVSKTKKPSDLINRRGKVSLSFVLNFNRQKEKRHSQRIFLRKLCLDF